jgi:enoyl-CoA hydratase
MIQTRSTDGLRTVVLDRPAKRNALTREGLAALREAIGTADEPVVYLTGAGTAFCAGADLDVVSALSGDAATEFARQGQRVSKAIADYDGAVVAGIDGAVRGGGVDIALACDLRIATPDATIASNGVRIGLLGAWGSTARLRAIVGEGNALDLALSGRVVDAETALRMGLVSRVVEEPRSVAAELAEHDGDALRAIKRLVRADTDRETAEERERAAYGELLAEHQGTSSNSP